MGIIKKAIFQNTKKFFKDIGYEDLGNKLHEQGFENLGDIKTRVGGRQWPPKNINLDLFENVGADSSEKEKIWNIIYKKISIRVWAHAIVWGVIIAIPLFIALSPLSESHKAYKTNTEDDVKNAILSTTWYGTINYGFDIGEKLIKYKFLPNGSWEKYVVSAPKGYDASTGWILEENGSWKTWYNIRGNQRVGVDMYPNKMRGEYRMDKSDHLYNITNTPSCFSYEWYGEDSHIWKKFGVDK